MFLAISLSLLLRLENKHTKCNSAQHTRMYFTGVPIIPDWRMIHTAGYTQDLKEKEYSIQSAATRLRVHKAATVITQL